MAADKSCLRSMRYLTHMNKCPRDVWPIPSTLTPQSPPPASSLSSLRCDIGTTYVSAQN